LIKILPGCGNPGRTDLKVKYKFGYQLMSLD
jgi:hypothetical protein